RGARPAALGRRAPGAPPVRPPARRRRVTAAPSISTPTLAHALEYAGRGWAVFPVDGKVPYGGTRGVHEATTDTATIAAWWRRWPHANVAIAAGASGLVILDVDTKRGDGFASLADLEADLGALPAAPTVRTPTGGAHLYFA